MNKLAHYIIVGVGILVICFLLWVFRAIVVYFFVAGILSLLAYPITKLLKKIRYKKFVLPPSLLALFTLLIFFLLISPIFTIIVPIIVDQIQTMSQIDRDTLLNLVSPPLVEIESFIQRYFPNQSHFLLREYATEQVNYFFSIDIITDFFGSLTLFVKNLLVSIFAITFLTFFFIKEEGLFFNSIIFLFPQRLEDNITRALQSIFHLLRRYFIGIAVDVSAVFGLNTLGLIFIAGLPWKTAVVMGAMTAIFNIIPYVGPLLGIGAAMLFGFNEIVTQTSMSHTLILVAIVFLFTQIIDMGLLQPLIYSNSVQAHPIEIFIIIFAAGSVGGIFAMLIAIPSYTVLRVLAKEFFNQYRLVQKLTQKMTS